MGFEIKMQAPLIEAVPSVDRGDQARAAAD
jgi:hypothetical protein